MAEYNKLTIYLGNKGILYDPIEYLKSHVIVYLDTSMLPPRYETTILHEHFNSIVPIIMKIIDNLEKLKNNDINAIGTIKLNIKEYTKLKEQFKKDYRGYVHFFKETYKNFEWFDKSFEEVFSSDAESKYSQYCYES